MIRRILKVSVALLLGLLLLFVGLNSWDEDLNPEAKPALAKTFKPTEQGLKAYFYLLGLRIGDIKDSENTGRAVWEQAQGMSEAARQKFYSAKLKRNEGIWSWLQFSARRPGLSASEYLKEMSTERERLPNYQNLSDAYVKLIFHREYSAPGTEGLSLADTPIQDLLKGHRLLTLRLGELIDQKQYEKVERLIRDENQFYKSFFDGQTLLGVMVAHLIIEDNAEILALEKKKNPRFIFKPETIASFKTPSDKEMFTSAMNYEFQVFHRLAMDMTDGSLLTGFANSTSESLFSLSHLKTRLFIKPNATVNQYYDSLQAKLRSLCAHDCPPNDSARENDHLLSKLRNPGGKWMNRIFLINVNASFEKMTDRSRRLQASVEQL